MDASPSRPARSHPTASLPEDNQLPRNRPELSAQNREAGGDQLPTEMSRKLWGIVNAWSSVVMSTAWEGVLLFVVYLGIRWVPKLRGQAVILLTSSLLVLTKEIMLLLGHTLTRAWIWRDLVHENHFEIQGSQLRSLLPDLLGFLLALSFLFVSPAFHVLVLGERYKTFAASRRNRHGTQLSSDAPQDGGEGNGNGESSPDSLLYRLAVRICPVYTYIIENYLLALRRAISVLTSNAEDRANENVRSDVNPNGSSDRTNHESSPASLLYRLALQTYEPVSKYIIENYLLTPRRATSDSTSNGENRANENVRSDVIPNGTSDRTNHPRRTEPWQRRVLSFINVCVEFATLQRKSPWWDLLGFYLAVVQNTLVILVCFPFLLGTILFSAVYALVLFFTGQHITVGVIVALEIVTSNLEIDLGKGFYEAAIGICFIIPLFLWINYLWLLQFIKFVFVTISQMPESNGRLKKLSELFYAVPVNPSQALTKISDNSFDNYAGRADRNPKLFFISVEWDEPTKLQCRVVDVEKGESYRATITTTAPGAESATAADTSGPRQVHSEVDFGPAMVV